MEKSISRPRSVPPPCPADSKRRRLLWGLKLGQVRRALIVALTLSCTLLLLRSVLGPNARPHERLHLEVRIQPTTHDTGHADSFHSLLSDPFWVSGAAVSASLVGDGAQQKERNSPPVSLATVTLISEDTKTSWRYPAPIRYQPATPWFSLQDELSLPEGWYRARIDVRRRDSTTDTSMIFRITEHPTDVAFWIAAVLIWLPLGWLTLAPLLRRRLSRSRAQATKMEEAGESGFDGVASLRVTFGPKEQP